LQKKRKIGSIKNSANIQKILLFSDHSYGFRPWCSAQQAIIQASAYINEGKEWVVDIDMAKFSYHFSRRPLNGCEP